jgi:hypothetical protein
MKEPSEGLYILYDGAREVYGNTYERFEAGAARSVVWLTVPRSLVAVP